ncbi:LLM class flavin-dependent oxidoreductase [Streptosporangium sp. NPDC000396]|uniref:LLM class flavin-dependent oxidoreductase n=1 Tax=Streptosporangium sp. NPDC000396 TaxID=3366185 RepID=UPI003692F3A1
MTFRFGLQLNPTAADLRSIRELTRLADTEGLDLLGVQDHPYAPQLADTFTLIGTLLADTTQIRIFPDVASLPLRGPALIAKAAATLDLLSGGRFELGLGAGGFQQAIAAMGGPTHTPATAQAALEEGIEIMRAMWQSGHTVRVTGEHYTVDGIHSGPAPAHPIGIWLGSVGPRGHAQTGRIADGWAAPIPSYLPYEKWDTAQRTISQAALDAGRDPADITRLAQIVGHITDTPARSLPKEGSDPIRATPAQWAEFIAGLEGFDAAIYWPEQADSTQLLRWTREVVPAARALIDKK